MQRTILEQIKQKALPVLKEADVTKAALFGSYARGDNKKDSDIDILIDFPRGKTLLDLIGLKNDLEVALKKKVDIVEYEGIHPLIKNSVLKYQYPIL
jgi:predicted nucleotidyltransferase